MVTFQVTALIKGDFKMKKHIAIVLALLILLSFVGCRSNSSQYTESEFIGVWMTQKNIETIQQMSNFQKSALQGNVSSLRICESNTVLYTPTEKNAQARRSYSFKGDSIVVNSTYTSFGNSSSGKKTYSIIKTDVGYELESNGKRYIKVCNDPYVYDISKFLE